MNCNVCGTQITNEKARFCPNCGATLNPEEQPAEAAAPATAAAAAAVREQPGPEPQPEVDPRQRILFNEDWAPIVKTGDWIGSLLIVSLVPLALSVIAGLVDQLIGSPHFVSTILYVVAALSGLLLTIWFAFGKRFNPSKRNFFKAYLILTIIAIVICIILAVVFAAFLVNNASQFQELQELTDIIKDLP